MRNKSLVQSIKWLLPLLFIFFINSKIFFTHTHYQNESIVVHSHPFKKGEKTTHHHTAKELLAIEFHTDGFSTDTIISYIEISSPFFTLIQHDYLQQENKFFSQKVNANLLRAPPYYS